MLAACRPVSPSSPSSSTTNSPYLTSLTSPSSTAPSSPALSSSSISALCVVCMDRRKDIALLPCQHAHCCLSCLRRSATRLCPICRAPVLRVRLLSTDTEYPVAQLAPPIMPRSTHLRFVPSNPRHSLPTLPRTSPRTFSMRSRATSMSSLNIATQAESSLRSLTQWEHHAFRQLRETGSLPAIPDHPSERPSSPSISSTSSFSSATDLPNTAPQQLQSIALMGHTRTIMLHLAHRLTSAFPPPPPTDGDLHRTKSTLYINGQLIRLVLIECPPNAAAPDIAARVQRQSPKLVLLCADFYNMSSFELVVRLDMDILDYLNISCIWVLMKTATNRPHSSNCVDDTDVSAANHFLGTPRRCFVVAVDGIQRSVNLKKLGMCIHRLASDSDRASQAHTFAGQLRLSMTKSLSSFCLAVHKSDQQKPSIPRNRQTRMPRWLWS